jgi:para-nitrobenzyl esterase
MRIRPLSLALTSFLCAVACRTETAPREQPAGPTKAELGTIVASRNGLLRGEYADSAREVLVFRGVPFAEPPVGERRWRPPQPPLSWKGEHDATSFGAPCWQMITPQDSIYSRGELERSENCLFLNLWTAARQPNERRPVMVWFHGGSHTVGHAASQIFDGAELARRGVVLVSANYRLGALGFMAHPALSAESPQRASGNYGILDKIEALEWVRDNAAAFGGDPGNVTIFGQSAGSASICYLMASPLAENLFHRAIGQSAACMSPRPRLAESELVGIETARALGLGNDHSAAAMRDADPETVTRAYEQAAGPLGGLGHINVDGWVFPRQMRAIYEAGEHNDVPLLAGSTADEGTALFEMSEQARERFEAGIRAQYGEHAKDLLAAYSDEIATSTKLAGEQLLSDSIFAWPMRTWARLVERRGNDAWLYYFSQPPPVFLLYLPDLPLQGTPGDQRGYGAYHSGDLAYVFGNVGLVDAGWSEHDHELARIMSQYWVNFAASGDPNGEGLPRWPRYEAASDLALELGPTIEVIAGLRSEKLDVWDRIHPPPGD